MSDKYKIFEGDEVYFVTFTITDCLNVLADDSCKMIIQATGKFTISEILRDLKKFTANLIIKKLTNENSVEANRTLKKFFEAGKHLTRIKNYKIWQDGNRAKLIDSKGTRLETSASKGSLLRS